MISIESSVLPRYLEALLNKPNYHRVHTTPDANPQVTFNPGTRELSVTHQPDGTIVTNQLKDNDHRESIRKKIQAWSKESARN